MDKELEKYPEHIHLLITSLELAFEKFYLARLSEKPSEKLFILLLLFEFPKFFISRTLEKKKQELERNLLKKRRHCKHFIESCSCESVCSKSSGASRFMDFEKNMMALHRNPHPSLRRISKPLNESEAERSEIHSMDEGLFKENEVTKDTSEKTKGNGLFCQMDSPDSGNGREKNKKQRRKPFKINPKTLIKAGGHIKNLRPIIYCLSLWFWSAKSSKPFMISLSLDLLAMELQAESRPEEGALRKLIKVLFAYLFRFPIFERAVKPCLVRPLLSFIAKKNTTLPIILSKIIDLLTSFSLVM